MVVVMVVNRGRLVLNRDGRGYAMWTTGAVAIGTTGVYGGGAEEPG
jgi:hypothetical protein